MNVTYLALSASESAFHQVPKVLSLSPLRRLVGRNGRCSRQKATYGLVCGFLAGGAKAGVWVGAGLFCETKLLVVV